MDKQASELATLKETLGRLEEQHRELATHILHVETMCADMLTVAKGLVDLLSEELTSKPEGDEVWVALRVGAPGSQFELLGVFLTEDAAVRACRRTYDMVGKVTLGTDYGDAIQAWPGAYYPLEKEEVSNAAAE
ncbi:MAG: hypothetical protein IPK79_00630 [Vampirovibrionales bacterium]|nr:hypothetical protein [Vampirovibrionales bacterium]